MEEYPKNFLSKNEFRQEDPTSTVLFNITLEVILRESGIRIEGLMYGVPAICQWRRTGRDIQEKIEKAFKQETRKIVGLSIDECNTKYVCGNERW